MLSALTLITDNTDNLDTLTGEVSVAPVDPSVVI